MITLLSQGTPKLNPAPKCLNTADLLFYNLTGVVVHGVGYFIFLSTDAQSSGCDLTIEVIYRLLICLQSHGYVFDSNLFMQADNHTDNKTPAVLFFLAYLVTIGAFHKCTLAFLLVGHGHLDGDQRNSVNSRALRNRSEFPISPSRFRQALRNGFTEESKKPTILEVDAVHKWAHWLAPCMKAVNLERLACSGNSGDAQYEYLVERIGDAPGDVGLFYKMFASDRATYPRRRSIGSSHISDIHGPGTVSECTYEDATGNWVSEMLYHNGHTEMLRDPPEPIRMFPDMSLIPNGSPEYEPMNKGWSEQVRKIKSNVVRCIEQLRIFSTIEGVRDDWDDFFHCQEERIGVCTETTEAPWCASSSELTQITRTIGTRERRIAQKKEQEIPPRAPLDIDPVTHTGFTSAHRAALQRAESVSLAPGVLVLFKLKFGMAVPIHHHLPFCLAYIPNSFNLATHPEDSLISFEALFAKGANQDLSTTWTSRLASANVSGPLRSILVTGVELTGARKLTAESKGRITALVSAFDLVPVSV